MEYQLSLFEEDSHLAILKQRLSEAPEFGPGDKLLVPDGGVQTVIVDRIVQENGIKLYQCHTDDIAPLQCYYTEEELFHQTQREECQKAWERLKDQYFHFVPKKDNIVEGKSFQFMLAKPYLGRRIGKVSFYILDNGLCYEAPLNGFTVARQEEEEDVDCKILKFQDMVKEHHGHAYECEPQFLEMFGDNNNFAEWKAFRFSRDNIRAERIRAINVA